MRDADDNAEDALDDAPDDARGGAEDKAAGPRYVLPGRYAVVSCYGDYSQTVTFQTRDELQEYLDELAEEEADEEEERWDATE